MLPSLSNTLYLHVYPKHLCIQFILVLYHFFKINNRQDIFPTMVSIVRKLPDFVPIPDYNTFNIFNEIPDTNNAKILIPYRHILKNIVQNYNSPLPIFVENDLSGIVSCMDFGTSFVVTYDECKTIYDKVETMYRNLDEALLKNFEIQSIKNKFTTILSYDTFILYKGIAYSDTIENIDSRLKQIQMEKYNAICRTLPKIHAVFKPHYAHLIHGADRTPCVDNIYNILSTYEISLVRILHIIIDPTTPITKYNGSDVFAFPYICHTRCEEYNHRHEKNIVKVEDLPELTRQIQNLRDIYDNEKILELYKKVYKFTDPLEYAEYKYKRYGNPELKFFTSI